jgi:hypothetical protein
MNGYGLKYVFSTNVGVKDKHGTLFIEGGKKKEYRIVIQSINITQALKSPAVWNCIADGGLVNPSTFETGLSAIQIVQAISRLLDQLSLMWGNSSIERNFRLLSPVFESYGIYTYYKFALTENGVKRDTAPIIILLISQDHPVLSS